MELKRIGALVIGQSPRPDLVDPLVSALPAGCKVLQAGALDGLTTDDLPTGIAGAYPLTTRMFDGALVMVDETFLIPKLQQALTRLEAQDVAATILLCAGTFSGLHGNKPLYKPFTLARDILKTLGIHRIGLIVPIPEQAEPIQQRWTTAGFWTTIQTADICAQDEPFYPDFLELTEANELEAVVLDYVGHPTWAVEQLQAFAPVPVIDLGQLTIRTLAATL